MTIEQQLAEVVALEIASALEPLQLKLGVLETRDAQWAAKFDEAQRTIADLTARVAVAEARPFIPGPQGPAGERGEKGADGLGGKDGRDGRNGKDAEPLDLQALTSAVADRLLQTKSDRENESRAEIAALQSELATVRGELKALSPAPDVAAIGQTVATAVAEAVGRLPVPKDGRDAPPVDLEAVARKAAALMPVPKDGRDGKDADSFTAADAAPLIAFEVQKAVAAIPAPKDGRDGKSLTPDDVQSLIAAEVSKAVSGLTLPKDGVGVSSALIDHEGALVLGFSDGTTKNLGTVVGKPGRDGLPGVPGRSGLDGKDGLDGKHGAMGPAGKDGRDGKDGANGKDGFGFEHLDLAFDEDKGCILEFRRGDEVKAFALPQPFDAGVWKAGRLYPKGACVTMRGHYWIALRQTQARPGDETPESKSWRMCVRAGQDGKPGRDGRNGSDL